MPHLFSAKMLRKEAHEIVGYFMRHKTGFDVAFSWNKDDPDFSEKWERIPAMAQPAPASTGREPFAWESTTPIYTRFITDARYQKLRPAYQKWYRPICNKCAPIAARELDVEAERREFEADYTVNQQREGANSEYIFLSLQRRGDGEYSTTYVNGRWHGWLAARSAAPSPNNPPVGGNSD